MMMHNVYHIPTQPGFWALPQVGLGDVPSGMLRGYDTYMYIRLNDGSSQNSSCPVLSEQEIS